MKFLRSGAVLVLALMAVAACDDTDDGTGVTIADLEGSWTATQFEYTDANGFGVDAISDAGGSASLQVSSTGSFTGQISVPGLTVDPQGATITVPLSGTLSIDPATDMLNVDFDAQTLAIVCPDPVNSPETCLFESFDADYTLNGDVLTFTNDDTSFDFPDDIEELLLGGARGEVDATLTATFER